MVTVDMSTTRAQITKRQRRMRRAAQRRMQRQHKVQLHEIRAAEAARHARQRAVAAWNAEEDRLQRLRETQQGRNTNHSEDASTPQEKPRAIKFADQVLVTEIPVCGTDKLPKPVSSPIGVSICGADDDRESDDDITDHASKSITFSQLPDGVFAEDDEDPEFTPDESLVSIVPSRPIQRPRRRIVAQRLDVPLEEIISSKHIKKSNTSHSPKRPRPETRQFSTPSSASAASSSRSRDQNDPRTVSNRTSKEGPTDEHKRHEKKPSANEESPKVRLKPKRKRLLNVDNDGRDENERAIVERTFESGANTNSDAAPRRGHADDQDENLPKSNHIQPSLENRASIDNFEYPLPTPSSADCVKQNALIIQNGQAKIPSKNGGKSPTRANGHSEQNGYKQNGFRHKLAEQDQHRHEPNNSDDDKELDNMFGDLINQKAASRVSKEKMAVRKKRKLGENGPELADAMAKHKKLKKGPARYTEDGLRIMTYEEIAADQPPGLNGDCPFDCSCCF